VDVAHQPLVKQGTAKDKEIKGLVKNKSKCTS